MATLNTPETNVKMESKNQQRNTIYKMEGTNGNLELKIQ